ncbi:MAG: glycosyltransferase family 4 protein [Thermodesulfobacteriota bacterium]|nr:glycosyltransferase family 4 protein [Thermodesulfobacteriota bacterium]
MGKKKNGGRLKLAFLLNNFYPYGGLEKSFLHIVHACISNKHQVTIFTMSWEGEKPQHVEVVLLFAKGMTNHGRALSFAHQFQKLANPSSFDLIVGFNRLPGLDLYYNADVCYVLDITRRRSFLSRLTNRYRTYAAFEKAVFGKDSTTHIMYISEAEKKNYISVYGTPDERFHCLPPGIDKKKIRKSRTAKIRRRVRDELRVGPDEFMLLMIGSDFSRKGVTRSIEALAALPDGLRKKTRLFVIGKGKEKPYLRQADHAGVADRTHFLGTRQDVPRFLTGADMLLHPAISETAGNVILEAMVAGLSVLVTAVCGFAFHVKKADAGCLVPDPFDQQEMNRLLAQMLQPDLLRAWGKNGFTYADAVDLYSRPQAAVKIIENIVAQKQAGGC